ncbi:uncharacterized protein [Euphorbia lathyris]|uniref:uncharacterized protein n=1 Tax=Euphorbia lathyris TaxID=212925 RepID=UPI0033134E3D
MGNTLRCCLACVIPCGALDLIRIVHLNGFVEEITHPITAGEILKANPNHILSKPCSQGVSRKILILSPESELKRGSIYFLIPSASLPEKKKKKKISGNGSGRDHKKSSTKSKKSSSVIDDDQLVSDCDDLKVKVAATKKSSRREHHHRRSGSRIGVWRPQLQSITED